ncbi:hypothetical protein ACE939_07490 [Aquimarina sp. W85]|uniref:hypothetical protein n=1 Tax=Aquimarina rhodophyticola TaxID=3342246 RepID=UPI00366C2E20
MKSLKYFIFVVLLIVTGMQYAFAQDSKREEDVSKEVVKKVKDKTSDKEAKFEEKIDEKGKRVKKKNGSQSMTSRIDEDGNEVFTITEKDSITGKLKTTELVVERENTNGKKVKKSKVKSKVPVEKH